MAKGGKKQQAAAEKAAMAKQQALAVKAKPKVRTDTIFLQILVSSAYSANNATFFPGLTDLCMSFIYL